MEPKKRGRKPLKEEDRVIVVSVYLKKEEKDAIIEKYGSVTTAIKEEILPRLVLPKNANI